MASIDNIFCINKTKKNIMGTVQKTYLVSLLFKGDSRCIFELGWFPLPVFSPVFISNLN